MVRESRQAGMKIAVTECMVDALVAELEGTYDVDPYSLGPTAVRGLFAALKAGGYSPEIPLGDDRVARNFSLCLESL